MTEAKNPKETSAIADRIDELVMCNFIEDQRMAKIAGWTKKKPLCEGWYWWRRPEIEEVMVVKVIKIAFTEELNILVVGNETMIPVELAHENCEWQQVVPAANT